MSEDQASRKTLRLPRALADFVAKKAAADGRSVNQEIISRLERTRWLDDPSSRPPEWRGGLAAAGNTLQG